MVPGTNGLRKKHPNVITPTNGRKPQQLAPESIPSVVVVRPTPDGNLPPHPRTHSRGDFTSTGAYSKAPRQTTDGNPARPPHGT